MFNCWPRLSAFVADIMSLFLEFAILDYLSFCSRLIRSNLLATGARCGVLLDSELNLSKVMSDDVQASSHGVYLAPKSVDSFDDIGVDFWVVAH